MRQPIKLKVKLTTVLLAFWMLFASLVPAYAFSWRDIAGQPIVEQLSANSGSDLLTILISLLFGEVNKVNTANGNGSLPGLGNSGPGKKELIGFYAEWWGNDTSSFTAMQKNAQTLNVIAPFWATLQADGRLTDRGGNDHSAVVKAAHQNKIKVLLLVNNDPGKNGQNTPIHSLLTDRSLRATAINNLENYIKKYGLDGINIDFEGVPAADRDNLSQFMNELATRLKPQGYEISIDVYPKQDETNDVSIAYDYSQLARYADKIIIMTYDNHGVWSGPGPVENNLRYALQFIPKNKLFLGIAGYGYDWSAKGVESMEYKPIIDLSQRFSAPIAWDEQAKVPHFSYTGPDGVAHEVWYENQASLQYKVNLVKKYDIAGAALWKLGEEDPGYWEILKTVFGK